MKKPYVEIPIRANRDVRPWLLVVGSSPGAYQDGEEMKEETVILTKEYTDFYQAQRDFHMLDRASLIDLMNLPHDVDNDWAVVTEGYEVGIYKDRTLAFILGLRWEDGAMTLCYTEQAARNLFHAALLNRQVRTKVKTVDRRPCFKVPIVRVEWVVEEI
ncbi:hypothetical protein V5O48_015316 [Marasmius crinis-equi]|uniref:Uncharacterized protein n=1 Tax=Marasmius crinis-equi TaxID=585013 RepID=A0ABR3EUX4_9AGAR